MYYECTLALIIGVLGASLNAPPLKDITWASEMRKRYAHHWMLWDDISTFLCHTLEPLTKWTPDLDSPTTFLGRDHSIEYESTMYPIKTPCSVIVIIATLLFLYLLLFTCFPLL